ncbi:hypothetical protein BUALT_Bualt06G0017000 [Buddleja alternifolia]|uniref:Uncharacterized protein n=1 Tax=Buddleja alternifolia TaxID=168488 RepID=A0AAV6XDA7_9LAMI|nr:hypothetical protein BUALT_Bualt06G0017000 [Buddleja alternifolia]
MLILPVKENRKLTEIHKRHEEAKGRGSGRMFWLSTLFEDMIKSLFKQFDTGKSGGVIDLSITSIVKVSLEGGRRNMVYLKVKKELDDLRDELLLLMMRSEKRERIDEVRRLQQKGDELL